VKLQVMSFKTETGGQPWCGKCMLVVASPTSDVGDECPVCHDTKLVPAAGETRWFAFTRIPYTCDNPADTGQVWARGATREEALANLSQVAGHLLGSLSEMEDSILEVTPRQLSREELEKV
jgi:predicted RNase H-like HicB family nuclease